MARGKGRMGLFSCVALIVGACIGSAIFSISGMTIYYAGASAILSWIIAAVIYGLYGMLVAKLAVMFPRSGGIYVFPRRALGGRKGALLGFISGWGYIISNIIAIAFSAIYFGIYINAGFPSVSARAVSLTAVMLALAILLFRSRSSQRIQNTLVLALIAIMLFYCGEAFFGGGFDKGNYSAFFSTGAKGTSGFMSAIPLAMVAYGGCVAIAFMASEVADPKRNIRRSLLIGLGIVATIYACMVAAIVGTLPMDVISENEGLRYIPLFASVMHGGLSASPWLVKVIAVSGAIALLTTVIALLRINSRAIQAIATEGLLPQFLARENGYGTAVPALVVMTAICLLLALMPQWTEMMITLGAVLNIVSMTITCVALIAARRKSAIFPLAVIALLWVCYVPEILHGSGRMWLFTAAVYLTGALVYLIFRKRAYRRVTGVVVHGKGHGRLHSMPTANLQPYEGSMLPREGVWETRVLMNGSTHVGVTNVGLRPTDDDMQHSTIETMILDFEGDIYDSEMCLEFVRFIRPTVKFDSLDELHAQIEKDIQTIKR